jgi:hypothetical protein
VAVETRQVADQEIAIVLPVEPVRPKPRKVEPELKTLFEG